MIPRIIPALKASFFLFGPRGTGKTTWLKMRFPEALRLDLLEPELFRAYSARPERLHEFLAGNPEKRTVIIDEVQKVPELLSVVHAFVEKKKNVQFILTGSSARKLKKTGADLLAGRLIKQTLHSFLAAELGHDFSLEKALRIGLIPLVLGSAHPEKTLSSYAALYVKEEVMMEGLTRSIGGFSRFLESISFSNGSVLNVSNVARDCGVERKTVEGYIGILEDLLLSFRLPVFAKRAKRAVISHSKFYYFDAGLYRSLRPSGPLDQPQEIEGVTLETLVAQHLSAWCAYRGDKERLYYWRTFSGTEVDFVVYGENVFWAIEVKNSARIRDQELRGLRTFKQDYPGSRALLVHRGKERFSRNGILCVPCEEFLRQLHPEKTQPWLLSGLKNSRQPS